MFVPVKFNDKKGKFTRNGFTRSHFVDGCKSLGRSLGVGQILLEMEDFKKLLSVYGIMISQPATYFHDTFQC